MKPRTFLAGSAVALALLLLGFGGWLFSLPPARGKRLINFGSSLHQ